jgi:hypothetical protein
LNRDNPLVNYYMSRSAPGYMMGASGIDALTRGRTQLNPYEKISGPTDYVKYLGSSYTPFVARDLIEGGDWKMAAATGLGLRASPDSATNVEAHKLYPGQDYANLDYGQRKAVQDAVNASGQGFPPTAEQAAATTFKQQRTDEQAGYEKAFTEGTNTRKISDYWHDLGQQRLGAGELQSDFLKQSGIQSTSDFGKRFSTLIEGYRGKEVTDANGQIDWDATKKAQAAYVASLPNAKGAKGEPGSQDLFNSYLTYAAGQKSELQQRYEKYNTARETAGYYNPGADTAALDKANPQLDVENWFFSSVTTKDGPKTNSLQSIDAVNQALSQNLPNRPVKYAEAARPINETRQTQQAWQDTSKYFAALDKAEAQFTDTLAQADAAKKKINWATATDDQKKELRSTAKAAISADLQKQMPEADAALAFWGRSTSVHSAALPYLVQMLKKYGIDPSKDSILQKVKQN